MNDKVVLVEAGSSYPKHPCLDNQFQLSNLREMFRLWGLQPDNPFSNWVRPGGRVLLKPNWVRDYNPLGHNIDSLITHTSLISSLIQFLAVAMKGKGTIIVADAPLQNCHFPSLLKINRFDEILTYFKSLFPELDIIVEDWRLTVLDRKDWKSSWSEGPLQSSGKRPLDKYLLVDLGKKSFLEDLADYSDRYRVTCYKNSLMRPHHRPGKHEYLVTSRISDVDLIINLPKMKTHIKAGLTGALKNLVGINGHKEFLPHHIKGPYFKGGDNYCLSNWFREIYEDVYDRYWEICNDISVLNRKLLSLQLKCLWGLSKIGPREKISAGSWSGNETLWRTILDLNHILYFSEWSPKKIITIVDGIVAGEGEGPLSPIPKPVGFLVGGENPAYVDAVLAKLMGYNISRIPTVYNAIYHRKSGFSASYLDDYSILWSSINGESSKKIFSELPNLNFIKPHYWERASAGVN